MAGATHKDFQVQPGMGIRRRQYQAVARLKTADGLPCSQQGVRAQQPERVHIFVRLGPAKAFGNDGGIVDCAEFR